MVKGSIELRRIRCVEVICCDVPIPCSYKYPFQVIFTIHLELHFWDLECTQQFCMQCLSVSNVFFSFRCFMTATTSTSSPPTTTVGRNGSELWKRVTAKSNVLIMINIGLVIGISSVQAICFLFLQTEIKNNNLVAKYHPNFWMDGKWRCCQQSEKLATGCQVYNSLGYGMCHCKFY